MNAMSRLLSIGKSLNIMSFTKNKAQKQNKFAAGQAKIGILGYGEVGQAIAKFYGSASSPQVKIKDLKRNDGLAGVEILHICLPWNKDFIKIVKKEIKEIKPGLVIIHSTVAPGTTREICSGLPRACRGVVHSPVRGVHPKLFEGIKTFVKYIGADNKRVGEMVKQHLEGLGMRTKVFMPSVATEIGKLLDTTYYGICIAWHGEMEKICDKFGVNFNEAVTDFNQSYNDGYAKLGKRNVVRPVLYAPKDGIGGHCVVPNAKILKKYFQSKAIDLILKYQ